MGLSLEKVGNPWVDMFPAVVAGIMVMLGKSYRGCRGSE